jgi:hypothetical protein
MPGVGPALIPAAAFLLGFRFCMEFGRRLRELRKLEKLTQGDMVSVVGSSAAQIRLLG